jgi:hypothetical protein
MSQGNKDLGALSGSREPSPASGLAPSGFDPARGGDPIVGHKTMEDGSHIPLRHSEAVSLWDQAMAAKARRESAMPTEQDAINAMFAAYLRLKELDWNDAIYCPKDGSPFDVVEAGSTGIFTCRYEGDWPDGHWWVEDGGDIWPSRPVLYRRTEAEKARWAALGMRYRDSDRHPVGGDDTAPGEACQSGPKGIAQPFDSSSDLPHE